MPSKETAKASAQRYVVRTAAVAAGTWTATLTLVAAAPAAIVEGVIVIVEPVGPPLAERFTAPGNVEPLEGAILKL
jgi:hypothetical protein